MQWLNSLDNAVDRVLINNDEQDDENDESVMMEDESHSENSAGPSQDDESFVNSTQWQSDTTLLRRGSIEDETTLDENDDFVAGEQAAGQDSTSCTMATLPCIEPDTSMLIQEKQEDTLPTSEPSGPSTTEPRGSIYHESHQRRASLQESENRGSIYQDSHARRESALQHSRISKG